MLGWLATNPAYVLSRSDLRSVSAHNILMPASCAEMCSPGVILSAWCLLVGSITLQFFLHTALCICCPSVCHDNRQGRKIAGDVLMLIWHSAGHRRCPVHVPEIFNISVYHVTPSWSCQTDTSKLSAKAADYIQGSFFYQVGYDPHSSNWYRRWPVGRPS